MGHENTAVQSRETYTPTKAATSIGKLPVMLNTDQCAALGGWSRKHINNMLNDGALRGVKLGNSWRVPRDYYLELLGLAEAQA